MAEIKISYIFIEKQKHESKTMQEILLEIIDNAVEVRDDEILKIDNVDVQYRIIQKKNSEYCFLEMTSRARVNRAIPALKTIDDALFKSRQQKYYHSIRDYDGISESFCKRLYPKYAEFERKLRSLVLFILTKAYGSNWQRETVSKELLSVLKENAHGSVSLNETLENMDLATLETYLFEKRHVDYPAIINEKLSPKNLEDLEKEEICTIIEAMRPTSLWERHFEKYGSQETWMCKIKKIHDTRNKVAHHKSISIDEFATINKKLNSVNRDLSNAIEGIREENFTEYGVIDILGSFATIARDLVKNIVESQAFRDVVIGFNAKIQEIVKPMTAVYKSSMVDALKSAGKTYANMNLGLAQSEMVKSMNALADSFSASKAVANSFASTKVLGESLLATKSIADNFATSKLIADSSVSTKALTQSFAASQILAESTKTTEMIQESIVLPEWEKIPPVIPYDDEEQIEDFDGKIDEGEE